MHISINVTRTKYENEKIRQNINRVARNRANDDVIDLKTPEEEKENGQPDFNGFYSSGIIQK